MADSHDEKPPERPMAPLATALADALEAMGWDGGSDVIAGEVRRPSDGTTLGRVEIRLLPFTAVIVDGSIAKVTPTAFLSALVASWSAAGAPKLVGTATRAWVSANAVDEPDQAARPGWWASFVATILGRRVTR